MIYRGAITSAENRYTSPPDEVEKQLGKNHIPNKTGNVTIAAQVNGGRWLVACPWCFSASLAHRTDKRFYCTECGNGSSLALGKRWRHDAPSQPATGEWAQVIWPDNWEDIESLLAMRPDPRTRNWAPPETLSDLLAENELHGVM